MTTLHLRRRLDRRFSALGLVLSCGLIFGASSIIRLNVAEHVGTPTDIEDAACEHESALHRAEWLAIPPPVPSEGRQDDERKL